MLLVKLFASCDTQMHHKARIEEKQDYYEETIVVFIMYKYVSVFFSALSTCWHIELNEPMSKTMSH